jgi:hypothetical protein
MFTWGQKKDIVNWMMHVLDHSIFLPFFEVPASNTKRQDVLQKFIWWGKENSFDQAEKVGRQLARNIEQNSGKNKEQKEGAHLGNAGPIPDQRYRTDHDVRMPMTDCDAVDKWQKW